MKSYREFIVERNMQKLTNGFIEDMVKKVTPKEKSKEGIEQQEVELKKELSKWVSPSMTQAIINKAKKANGKGMLDWSSVALVMDDLGLIKKSN